MFIPSGEGEDDGSKWLVKRWGDFEIVDEGIQPFWKPSTHLSPDFSKLRIAIFFIH